MSETPEETKEDKKALEDQEEGLMSVHMVGYEVIEKVVKSSGNTGRVYLPFDWIGSRVKIVRIHPIKEQDRKKRRRRRRI